jgi:hypothetical protein
MNDATTTQAKQPASRNKNRRTAKRKMTARTKTAKTASAGRGRQPTSKTAAVLTLLKRPDGATLPELMKTTGWQAHSVRGFLSGTVRKRLGLALISEAGDSGRRYRIDAEVAKSGHGA